MAYAVVACSECDTAWAVDLRYKTSRCPRCPALVDLRRRKRFWQGDSPSDARQAAAALNTAIAQGRPVEEAAAAFDALADPRPVPRHDSAVDAAAAKAAVVVNKSQKAEVVALWLSRLQGDASEDDFVGAMHRAGVDRTRAEKELVRLLACDVVYEPVAGRYRALET